MSLICIATHAKDDKAIFPFKMGNGSGTLRLGVVIGNQSQWLDACQVEKKGNIYTIKDNLLKGGTLQLIICPLTKSSGFIIEISGDNLPKSTKLLWAFGACNEPGLTELKLPEDPVIKKNQKTMESRPFPAINPADCKDNVHSDEGQAFTTYYGASLNLRVTSGVTPPNEGMRLANAYKQDTPLSLYQSGKKTDAPVLTALCPMDEKLYICLYKQNAQADYNYFMMPELFRKENKK